MKKNLLLLALCAVVMVAIPLTTCAQTPDKKYQETLHKMLVVSGGFASAEAMIPQAINMLRQKSDIPEDFLKMLSAAMTEKYINRMTEVLAPIYQKHLTLKDLKKIIAFYNKPVGKKLGLATPVISLESMQVGQQLGMEIIAEIEEALKEYDK